jgi:hypothetical protein
MLYVFVGFFFHLHRCGTSSSTTTTTIWNVPLQTNQIRSTPTPISTPTGCILTSTSTCSEGKGQGSYHDQLPVGKPANAFEGGFFFFLLPAQAQFCVLLAGIRHITLCMLVSVCFHNLVTFAQRLQDLYSACLMFWMRTHTGPRFIISSEGRESHQPQVIWASHTNSKILVPDGPWNPNFSHWSRTRYHCATGSLWVHGLRVEFNPVKVVCIEKVSQFFFLSLKKYYISQICPNVHLS